MICIETFVLLATVCLLSAASLVPGGKQPISNEDFGSESFGELVEKANHQCNSDGNQPKWYKQEAILGGTKQLVSGILYEFYLRQRQTECARDEMLKRGADETRSFCIALENATTAVCAVKIWHKPWVNFTQITVGDIWFIDVGDDVISETIRFMNESYRGLDRTLIDDAITDFNHHEGRKYLYKFTSATDTYRQHNGEHTRTLKVTLTETTCPTEKYQTKNFEHTKDECYDSASGDWLECTLEVNKMTAQRPQFSECKRSGKTLRGMWRSSAQGSGEVSWCYPDPNIISNGTNTQKVALKNFARSDIRVLSADEINDVPFQDLLKSVIWKYNNQSKQENVYKVNRVENAKIEFEPKRYMMFNLWAEETPCKKQQNSRTNEDNFVTECTLVSETLSGRRLDRCQVTVTNIDKLTGPSIRAAFGACKEMPGVLGTLLGGQQVVKPGTPSHETSLVIANQAVEQYNSKSNDLYVYQLGGIQNAICQVASGTLYTMNLTMKAVSCKNTKDESCLNPSKEDYLHCMVSALVKPRMVNREVNITNCWQRVVLTQPMDGTWSYISPEEVLQLRDGDLLRSVLQTYQAIYGRLAETTVDHLSDGFKIKNGMNEYISFKLHLRGTGKNQTRYECDVIAIHQKGQPDKRRLSKCVRKAPQPVEKHLLGGRRKIPEEHQRTPEFRSKLRVATKKYNRMSNDVFYHRLFRVENPVTQVVAGVLTSFTLHMQRTSCMKNIHTQWHSDKAPHLCGKLNNTHMTVCFVKIWEKPWENFTQVDLQNCQLLEVANRVPVQPTSDDLQASDAFKGILHNVAISFNLNTDKDMLYEIHMVDAVELTTEKPDEMKFNLTMKPTNCRKWDDVMSFRSGQFDQCIGSGFPKNFVKCSVKVLEFDEGATLHLRNCEYIHFGDHVLRRLQKGHERTTVLFQQAVDQAVNLFNARVDSPYWYKFLAIENPTIEHISGPQYTFILHMLPKGCRPASSLNDTIPNSSKQYCNVQKPDFMISCRARYWQRAWPTFRETIDVSDCEVIPITQKSARKSMTSDNNRQVETNLRCIDSHEKRLVKLFEDHNVLRMPYERVAVENVEEQSAPGKRLSFELYLKPEATGKDCSMSGKSTCSAEKHFYVCKGIYWWKDWQEAETFELSQCTKVSTLSDQTKPMQRDSALTEPELNEIVSKAVALYNDKLAEFYLFEKEEVQNIIHVTDAGKKTTFGLVMKPKACKPTPGKRSCQPHLSKTRINCAVTVWQRPWLGENEQIWLQNCREYFFQEPGLEPQPISDEERDSAAFAEMVKKLGNLYTGPVPILYKVQTYQNAMAHQNETHRIISLTLILEPTGCEYVKPNSNDPMCRDWKNQDKVVCDAEIIQHFVGNAQRILRLTGCIPIVEPIKKRYMKPSEFETGSFKQALRKAWELFHQMLGTSEQLYNVVNVKDGTIEREKVQTIKYTVTFEETDCIRGTDDRRFEGVYASSCRRRKPQVQRNCDVEVTTNEQSQNVSLRCEAS